MIYSIRIVEEVKTRLLTCKKHVREHVQYTALSSRQS